jgi:hypothetical protein
VGKDPGTPKSNRRLGPVPPDQILMQPHKMRIEPFAQFGEARSIPLFRCASLRSEIEFPRVRAVGIDEARKEHAREEGNIKTGERRWRRRKLRRLQPVWKRDLGVPGGFINARDDALEIEPIFERRAVGTPHAVGEACMVASDAEGYELPDLRSKALDRDPRPGRGVIDPTWAAIEIALELRRVLPEVMQQAGGAPPLSRAELGGALAREGGDVVEMRAQRLPVGAVGAAGGMGEIGALSVQGISTTRRECVRFSKTSEYGNRIVAGRADDQAHADR